MLRRLFIDHPASAGESYAEHLGQAARFSAAMFVGALACLVHAVVPGLCKRTGSGIIRDLNERMITNRTSASYRSASSALLAPADGDRCS